jgi:hypothetical protein
MLILSYVIKHIITNRTIFQYLFYVLFALYNKRWINIRIQVRIYIRILYLSFEKIYDKFKVYF